MSAPNADIKSILEKAESLIAQGKTKEALSQLTALNETSFRKKFVGLSNQFSTLEEQSRSGVLTNEEFLARKARVNASVLSTIQQVEIALTKGPITGQRPLKLIMGIVLGVLLLFLGYKILRPEAATGDRVLDCPNGHKKAVKVAKFQQDATGGFSESLMAALQGELNQNLYNTAVVASQAVNDTYYHDTIQLKHFEQSCDTSGLFVNGRWDTQLEVFNCWIDLFDLEVKIPGLESNQSIILNNPPGITFSVREDSKFLADFILAILKTHEGEGYEALKLFNKLEKDSTIEQDEKLKGNLAYYKAIAYTTRGDQKRAKEQFTIAALSTPNLKDVALKNIKVAEQVAEIMNNDPELKPILANYLTQDSLLETPEIVETPPLLTEKSTEPVVIEKVAEKMEKQTNPDLQESAENIVKKDTLTTTEETDEQKVLEDTRTVKNDSPKFIDINGIQAIRLAGKTWMAQNLNVEVADSWCYDDDPKNCQKYGRLYTWGAAKRACAALGDGWRLPRTGEWMALVGKYGGVYDSDNRKDGKTAYQALIKGGSSGFAALPGGFRNFDGKSMFLGRDGYYWSGTGNGAEYAWYYWFNTGIKRFERLGNFKTLAVSCRCVKDD